MNRTVIPVILLAEDDPKDVDITARALRASNLANRLVVTRDGVEALEYLRREGAYSAREPATRQSPSWTSRCREKTASRSSRSFAPTLSSTGSRW